MTMNKPDILMIVSDQHTSFCSGFMGDKIVRTPNLDRLAAGGTVFESAYTSCPLCVPARSSLMTGVMPSGMNVFSNGDSLPSDQPTFAHAAAINGYETVLCGRMHFVGEDQHHGFSQRIFGDILHRFGGGSNERMGAYAPLLGYIHCLDRYGRGYNPVLAYDADVANAAVKYLSEEHEKPQMITTGFYGPHFPYFAPADLFDYYRSRVTLPETRIREPDYRHEAVMHKEQNASDECVLDIRAAYYAMIETMDRETGKILEAWYSHLEKNKREGIIIYASDHGDQIGERNIYGKQTFYEMSAGIPMIINGCGIPKGIKISSPVSINDIAPTICDLVSADPLPSIDGTSLLPVMHGEKDGQRPVFCEYVDNPGGRDVPGRMVRFEKWKLISYAGYDDQDLLFDLEKDPYELNNVIGDNPETAQELKALLKNDWNPEEMLVRAERKKHQRQLMHKWGKAVRPDDPLLWQPSAEMINRLHAGMTGFIP